MKKKSFIVITAISLVFTIIAVGIISNSFKTSKKEIKSLSASWTYNYADIEELSKNSDLIALVKVDGAKNTEETNGILFTEFKVDIIESIYNAENMESFVIYMTGGENDDLIMEITDDPLMQSDEEFLVFCQKNSDGTYTILSGQQGRLVYENGVVNSLNVTNSKVREANPYSNIEIQNADYKELVEEIKGYVG